MSLNEMNHEKIENMSLIELAKHVFLEEKKPMKFTEAFEKVSNLKGLTEAQKQAKMSQFYTELNIEGSFVMSGGNTWGLKRWYRIQKEESAATTTRRRANQTKKIDVAEIDADEMDELAMIDEQFNDAEQVELDEEELEVDFGREYDD